jgi:hypothetical protein
MLAMNRPSVMASQGRGQAEAQGDADGFQVELVRENPDEIVEPDEAVALPERVAQHQRLEQPLGGRPVKKRQRHHYLGRDQQVGQGSGCKNGTLDHGRRIR